MLQTQDKVLQFVVNATAVKLIKSMKVERFKDRVIVFEHKVYTTDGRICIKFKDYDLPLDKNGVYKIIDYGKANKRCHTMSLIYEDAVFSQFASVVNPPLDDKFFSMSIGNTVELTTACLMTYKLLDVPINYEYLMKLLPFDMQWQVCRSKDKRAILFSCGEAEVIIMKFEIKPPYLSLTRSKAVTV